MKNKNYIIAAVGILAGAFLTQIIPSPTAHAQAPAAAAKFAHLQFTANVGAMRFFDNMTGEIWEYERDGRPRLVGTLVATGENLK